MPFSEYELLRDGNTVASGTVLDLTKYIHGHHSFSLDWAVKHEGYELRPICEGCYKSPCECLPDDAPCDPA